MSWIRNTRMKGIHLLLLSTLLISGGLLFSACTDIDGESFDFSDLSQCDYTTSTFTTEILSGLSELTCTQTALSKSLAIGLQLIPGFEIDKATLAEVEACGTGLLFQVVCIDQLKIAAFSATCTLTDDGPDCNTLITPNEILINAIAGILGTEITLESLLEALEICGLNLDADLLHLNDGLLFCLLGAVESIL